MARPARANWTLLLGLALLILVGSGFAARVLAIRRAEATIERHLAEIGPLLTCDVVPSPATLLPHPWGKDNAWDLLHPAIDALWEIRTVHASASDLALDRRPDFEGRGTPEDTERHLQEAEPHFDACRRAAQRSLRDWQGPLDDQVAWKGLLAAQHLCARAFLAFNRGQDAEAFDWLIVALTVAQDCAGLDPPNARVALHRAELWTSESARLFLSKHALTPSQLEDIRRRLDRLQSARPRPIRELSCWSARVRETICHEVVEVTLIDRNGVADRVGLEEEDPGWRDLFSPNVRKARILTEIEHAGTVARSLPWTSSSDLETPWTSLCVGYSTDDLGQLWSLAEGFREEYAALLRRDLLRAAVGVAIFDATHGRMPATPDEAGIGSLLRRPVALMGRTLGVDLYPRGTTEQLLSTELEPNDLLWTIRRR